MKSILYLAIVGFTVLVLQLTHTMSEHPYTSEDMRGAYYHGCNYGSRPLTKHTITKCQVTSQFFKMSIDTIELEQ